ncbi:hypothetical protein [Anabaena catenula]|uniref:Uncharacterized protein n=1 Tax=Anabaena catenula FACHB-362 TaxID=2692877 RepID=A0ABR8JAU0_9NOST|nr:hypothetical protein [Anabaena catenula]MBD2694680.1 hypothetical protein [Anabaena catenula FACHB-362]
MKTLLSNICLGLLLSSNFAMMNTTSSIAQNPSVQKNSPRQNINLPKSISDKLLQDMAWKTFVPRQQVKIIETKEATFDGCLGLGRPEEACPAIALFGWKVKIQAREHIWTYHVTQRGNFKVNTLASLSKQVADELLTEAAWRSDLEPNKLQIYAVENKTWKNSCLDLPGINNCINAKMPGWQITVIDNKQQSWVYRTGLTYTVLFDAKASKIQKNIPSNFPQENINVVLKDMSKRTGISLSELQIMKVEPKTFNGCLNIATPETACNKIALSGWRIVAQGYQQRWVYHLVNGRGFKLNGIESLPKNLVRGVLKDVYFPNEKPPANLTLYWAEQKVWTDSCRGAVINNPQDRKNLCQPGFFPSWIVTTTNGATKWEYHTGIFYGTSLEKTINQK